MTSVGEERTGPGLGARSVEFTRIASGRYAARNPRGGELTFGSGDDSDFTPVELLLTAIAGCSAVDVDLITGKRAEPTAFDVTSNGTKIRDQSGNRLTDIEVTFTVRFPDDEAGDRAREMLPRALAMSHDRLCTVSRTVQVPTPVTMRLSDPESPTD